MLGTSGGERRNAFVLLERTMQGEGFTWTDIGNAIEQGGSDKHSEAEMQEFAQAARAEGVEAGIKIGQTRAKGNSNNGLMLPTPPEMAEFCHDRLARLKDDRQRDFVSDIYVITRPGRSSLSAGRLGYLASIYIQIGGKT